MQFKLLDFYFDERLMTYNYKISGQGNCYQHTTVDNISEWFLYVRFY